jgi:hypothetical protein
MPKPLALSVLFSSPSSLAAQLLRHLAHTPQEKMRLLASVEGNRKGMARRIEFPTRRISVSNSVIPPSAKPSGSAAPTRT